jgi:pSer/pThr/pTyr-binding forkhead associated (FHA) protein
LPDVIVVTENEIQLRYYSTEALVSAEQGGRVLGRVAALFDREANTIFLADLRSKDGTGLLHELVHYLQDINGKDDMFADHWSVWKLKPMTSRHFGRN